MPFVIDLSDQTAWVTGGASGIGRAIAATLARAGARVVSLDVQQADQAGGTAGGIATAHLDVRDSAAVQSTTADLAGRGLEPDVLVNCAGITRDNVVWKLSDEDWEEVLDVNLTGAFRLTRACAPIMRRRGHGVIVNIASINAVRGKFGQANYAASKGGLVAFTKTIARELARFHVRVNAVAPGFIDTPMTRRLPDEIPAQARSEILLGRLGDPSDVAHAVLFLASPLASHITGHVLVVDGGQTV
jgi:acetoacetyl-CoA reductase/3-oxoacyl-[acyl-carrier protein] reductase